MENKFRIPLNGLVSGSNQYHWDAGIEFFQEFENTEMQSADFIVDAEALKTGRKITVHISIEGTVTVLCDRCMEDLQMPIDDEIDVEVAYGEEDAINDDSDEDKEVIEKVWVPDGETDIDLSQIVYDYICLGLPMQRFHPEGQCNKAAIERLENGVTTASEEPEDKSDDSGNPFSALKGLFE